MIRYCSHFLEVRDDFGTSNENSGMYLNDGLYKYKTEFGGGGVVHEYFEFCLTGWHNNG